MDPTSRYNKMPKPKLPPNWEAHVSKTHPDFVYYFNRKSGCTTWTLPVSDTPTTSHSPADSPCDNSSSSSIDDFDEESEVEFQSVPDTFRYHSPLDTEDYKVPTRSYNSNNKVGSFNSPAVEQAVSSSTNHILSNKVPIKMRLGPKTPAQSRLEKIKISIQNSQKEGTDGTLNLITSRSVLIENNDKCVIKAEVIEPSSGNKRGGESEHYPQTKRHAPERSFDSGTASVSRFENYLGSPSVFNISSPSSSTSASPSSAVGTPLSRPSASGNISLGSRGNVSIGSRTKAQNRLVGIKAALTENQNSPTFSVDSMDWEDIPEQEVVTTIQNLREQASVNNEPPKEESSIFLRSLGLQCKSHEIDQKADWFLVFDTNIFISCLNFIKEMRDTNIKGLGRPTLCIPWIVTHELDALKERKCDNVCENDKISVKAREAVKFLSDNLKYHPNIRGQSYLEFIDTADLGLQVPDDEVLKFCLQLLKNQRSKVLILLTNDRILRIKAHSTNINAFSKDEFVEEMSDKKSFQHSKLPDEKKNTQDSVMCSLRELMLKSLTNVVRSELIANYSNDWKNVVSRPPPWLLEDLFENLEKHWVALFRYTFTPAVRQDIALLKKFFVTESSSGYTVSSAAIREMLEFAKSLFSALQNYPNIKDSTLSDINLLISELKTGGKQPRTKSTAPATVTKPTTSKDTHVISSPASSTSGPDNQVGKVDFIDKLKRLTTFFAHYWDNLRLFCLLASDIMGLPLDDQIPDESRLPVSDVRQQLTQLLLSLENITRALKETLAVPISNLNERTPQVCNMYETINTIINGLPKFKQFQQLDLSYTKIIAFYFQQEHDRLKQTLDSFNRFRSQLIEASDFFDQHNV